LALQFLNRHPEAIASYRRSLALAPERADAYSHLGNTLEEIGQAAAAQQAFERAVALAPRRGRFYYQLSEHRQFAAGDPYLAAMEELAGDLAALPPDDRIELLFALAKAHADLAEPQRSFECLVAANMLKHRQIDYDEAATLGSFERIRTTFTLALMHADRDLGNPSPVPVFIIGMPRSGTTLIEQILASHPKVFGAGELPEFENAAKCVFGSGDSPTLFPEVVPSLSGAALRRIGTRYVAAVTALAPGASRITDKMPVNFRYAGLIHRALPNARIIHCRRDPIDTCLSCFSKLFTEGQAYSYALGELGRYYRGYYRLMEHWRGVLPAHVMIEVSYEDVVADLETQARRIVAHCGLEWDAACLTFDRTERPIRTASASQVRRPIYRTSVGRWRAYGRLLDPLMEALGPVPGPA
jgi:tetratricopeptide (TPR) repeat protein